MDVIDFIVAVSVAEYIVALIRDEYHKEYKAGEYVILWFSSLDWYFLIYYFFV